MPRERTRVNYLPGLLCKLSARSVPSAYRALTRTAQTNAALRAGIKRKPTLSQKKAEPFDCAQGRLWGTASFLIPGPLGSGQHLGHRACDILSDRSLS